MEQLTRLMYFLLYLSAVTPPPPRVPVAAPRCRRLRVVGTSRRAANDWGLEVAEASGMF